MLTATGRAGPGGAAPSPDLEDAYRVCEGIVRGHYENFPVASKFIPKASRRALAAVYAFARRADDYADEGYGPGGPTQGARLAALEDWERRLARACGDAPLSALPSEGGASLPDLPGPSAGAGSALPPTAGGSSGSSIERAGSPAGAGSAPPPMDGEPSGSRAEPAASQSWAGAPLADADVDAEADAIFLALADAIRQHDIPPALFHDLLSAFRQDVVVDEYATRSDLLEYCRRSANPVGRIVLAVHGVHGEPLLAWSDAICTGLQLANFWQDAGVDRAKSRIYLPREDRERFGVSPGELDAPATSAALRALVLEETRWTRTFFESGRRLLVAAPGGLRVHLRLVWNGGVRILELIEKRDGDVLGRRPKLGRADWVRVFLRAALPVSVE